MKIVPSIAFIIASFLPFTAAADLMIDKSVNKAMESMTVAYRTPIEYALYQYTTEMLANFRLQLQADIYQQARTSTLKMASTPPYISVINLPLKEKVNGAE